MNTEQQVRQALKDAIKLCDAAKIPVVLTDAEVATIRAVLYARSGNLVKYALADIRMVTGGHSERRARQIDVILETL